MHLNPTNVAVTTTHGKFLFKLKKNGNTIASHRFDYYRSGNNLYPSDPGNIQEWASNYPNADDFSIETSPLDTVPITSGGGKATMQASSVYMGEVKATATTSWHYEPVCFDRYDHQQTESKAHPNMPPIGCRPGPGPYPQ
jgi:hypothetical protein